MSSEILRSLVVAIFCGLVLAAAVKDLTSYTIPNWVSGLLAVAFAPAALAMGASLVEVGLALLLGVGLLVLGIVMFALRWMGGGDAKLLAAAAPWLGLAALPRFLLCTGLAGGALALLLLALRSDWIRPFAESGPGWARRLATPGENTPYGVAIAIGALAAFPASLVMRLAHGAL